MKTKQSDARSAKITMSVFVICFVLFHAAKVSVLAGEEEAMPVKNNGLQNSWKHIRSSWEKMGVGFEGAYKIDVLSNVKGGMEQKTKQLANLDLKWTVDAEKLLGWKNATIFLYGLGNHGENVSESVGDVQGVDNIEAPDTFKLFEAWVEQKFLRGKASLLIGLHDLNSEFYVTDSSSLFLHSSHGIGPDFSQSGLNGPSIFPQSALGLRFKMQPDSSFYIQTMVNDAVSGCPGIPKGTHAHLHKGEGALFVAEAAYLTGADENARDPYGKIAFGAWAYTGEFEDILEMDSDGNPLKRKGNSGLYLLFERNVFREKEEPSQGMMLFTRMGTANSRFNQIGFFIGGGFVYKGVFRRRGEDEFGFAAAHAVNGESYMKAQENAGGMADNAETNFELTYRAEVSPGLVIQPDVQFVVNPGMDPSLNDAFVLGARFELSF